MSEDRTFRPLSVMTVQRGSQNHQCYLHIPRSIEEGLQIEKGDRFAPFVQDGMLVFVPLDGETVADQFEK